MLALLLSWTKNKFVDIFLPIQATSMPPFTSLKVVSFDAFSPMHITVLISIFENL
jgi:hypothetical protein